MKNKDKEFWSGGILGSAYMDFGKPCYAGSESFLPIYYNFPYGEVNSLDQNSVLVRPFKKLLRDGKPIGKISYVFYKDNNEYYTLGAFACTSKRLIFFPGVIPKKLIESPADQKFLENNTVYVDHLSLESNWRNWHISFSEKETTGHKISSKNTKRLQDDTFLWFVMAVRSSTKLETMPKTQEIKLFWPSENELKRKLKEIIQSRYRSLFHVVEINEQVKEDHYLNFEFFLSKSVSKNDSPRISTVYTAKHLSNNAVKFIEHTRIHPIILQDYSGSLSIRVSKPEGKLNFDGVFIPGKDFL